MDAGDEQAFADAALEQRHRGVEPRAAAGQRDDGIGMIQLGGPRGRRVGKDDEADGIEHCRDRDQPHEARVKAANRLGLGAVKMRPFLHPVATAPPGSARF